MYIHENLKFLRQRRGKTQEQLASEMDLERASWAKYEKSVSPTYANLVKISDYFGISIDHLLRTKLESLQESKLRELEQGRFQYIAGKHLRVLVSTVDRRQKDNIEMVSVKAKAGYLNSYADPEYVGQLPSFQLPILDQSKKYRGFQIEGDSMLPIAAKSWVVASHVEDWKDIKDGQAYVLITKEDCVFKIVYNQISTQGSLQLVSLNPEYRPYEIEAEQLLEVWRFEAQISREIGR